MCIIKPISRRPGIGGEARIIKIYPIKEIPSGVLVLRKKNTLFVLSKDAQTSALPSPSRSDRSKKSVFKLGSGITAGEKLIFPIPLVFLENDIPFIISAITISGFPSPSRSLSASELRKLCVTIASSAGANEADEKVPHPLNVIIKGSAA